MVELQAQRDGARRSVLRTLEVLLADAHRYGQAAGSAYADETVRLLEVALAAARRAALETIGREVAAEYGGDQDTAAGVLAENAGQPPAGPRRDDDYGVSAGE